MAWQIESSAPRVFAGRALLVLHAYNLFLVLPVVAAAMVMSLTSTATAIVLLPFLALGVTACFLPFGLGNLHVSRLVRTRIPAPVETGERFIVQLTCTPRLRSGVRGLLEDADDIGWLTATDTEVLFTGDSVRMVIPLQCVREIISENIGLRGLFVYGPQVALELQGVPKLEVIQFAERSSLLLPGSHRTARRLWEELDERLRAFRAKETGQSI